MTKRWIHGVVGLFLIAPLITGCGDRQLDEGASGSPAEQSRPNAPPMASQSDSQESLGTPGQVMPMEKQEDKSTRDITPGDRG